MDSNLKIIIKNLIYDACCSKIGEPNNHKTRTEIIKEIELGLLKYNKIYNFNVEVKQYKPTENIFDLPLVKVEYIDIQDGLYFFNNSEDRNLRG